MQDSYSVRVIRDIYAVFKCNKNMISSVFNNNVFDEITFVTLQLLKLHNVLITYPFWD